MRFLATVLLLACSGSDPVPDSGGPAPVDSADTGTNVDSGDSGDTDTDVPEPYTDALVWLARSDTDTFFETNDLEVVGDVLYACTAVKGLVLHDIADPAAIAPLGSVPFISSKGRYPRCSHLHRDGDRVLVTARRDEIQQSAFAVLLDVSDPRRPVTIQEWTQGPDIVLEQGALAGGRAWLASGPAGLRVFEVDEDGLIPAAPVTGLGSTSRVTAVGNGVVVGTVDGRVHRVAADGTVTASWTVSGAVTAMEPVDDDTLLVALGSDGLVTLDLGSGAVVGSLDMQGTALRLDPMGQGRFALGNWTDVRVIEVVDRVPVLRAVDDVFQAHPRPRHLAAAGSGDVLFGEDRRS